MGRTIRISGAAVVVTCFWGWFLAAPVMGASPQEMGESARRAGNAMYDAFRKGRLDEFVSYTYPGLIKLMGGKEKMVEVLQKGLAEMAEQGFRFLSGKVGVPTQVVKAGPEIHALLPMSQIMSAPGGELHVESHMVAVSSNGGQTWTFIDTGKMTPENIRTVLPNFNPELKLPRKSEPKFVPKK